MAQNALTVTPPNPTPPTNFVNTGATPPNPATYDPTCFGTDPHYPPQNQYPPQYDDGTAGSLVAFAAKHAALLVGGTSVDHEGLGTEVVVNLAYPPAYVGAPVHNPCISFSCLGNYTNTPNASHASTLSGTAVPTLTGVSAGGASGVGTAALTATGTNFNRASVINANGIPQNTTYVSPTSLTTNAVKKVSAGTVPVTVTSNGVTTAAQNWTFT